MGIVRNKFVRDYVRAVPGAIRLAASSRWPIGIDIFDEDWDLLLILDTCRVDALREVQNEYDYLSEISAKTSIGGATPEWIANTFTSDREPELGSTGYISATGWSKAVLEDGDRPELNLNCPWAPTDWNVASPSSLGLLDHSWQYIQEEVPGQERVHPSPQKITERAIHFGRSRDLDRMVVHYVQPHYPYIAEARSKGRDNLDMWENNPFEYLRSGGERTHVWQSYLDELRQALDSIKILLQNYSANRVVITSDHGEAFGEYGMHGHRSGSFHPKIRKVPWAITSASDEGDMATNISNQRTHSDVKDQLQGLGYLE